jgi:hypothetical protein
MSTLRIGRSLRSAFALVAGVSCALLASASSAVTFDEIGGPDLLGDTFAGRTVLVFGTDEVRGEVWRIGNENQDFFDYFSFVGLVPGALYELEVADLGGDLGTEFTVFDSLGAQLDYVFVPIDTPPVQLQVLAGGTGELVVRTNPGQDFDRYSVRLTLVPEPGSLLLVAAGLAALAGRRRGHAIR